MIDMRNITPLPSGTFRVRIEHRGEVLSGVVASVEEAVVLRDEMKRRIVDGSLAPTKGATAFHLGPRFLSSRSGNRSSSDDERRWHKRVAKARWAQKPIASVTRRDGLDWLAELERAKIDYDPKIHGVRTPKTLSWETRKHLLVLSRRFFDWCMDQELISANPFIGLRVERQDGDEDEGYQEEWYLDAEEQTRFLSLWDTLDDLNWRGRLEKWIVAFALATGLREGELWCLHLTDVHVDVPKPYLIVRYGSWDAVKQRYRPPKGRKGEKRTRRVELWGLGLEAAKQWLAVRDLYLSASPKILERRKTHPPTGTALMFPTERGLRRDKKPPRSWAKVVDAFGVVPRIGERPWWHLLRHSCASSLVSGWWGVRWLLQDVQTVLGHTDIRTTQRYAHLSPTAMQETAERAHAVYVGRHDAVTAKSDNVVSIDNYWRARQDSNLRPTASEAVIFAEKAARIRTCDGAVTAIRHVLEEVAAGRLAMSPVDVAGLGVALDLALEEYRVASGGVRRA